MALALGKRKRTQDVSNKSQKVKKDDGSDDEDAIARALFQRAFEKKFKPLPKIEKPANQDDTPSSEEDEDEDDDEDDDSENSGSDLSKDDDDNWSGISENEADPQPAKPQIEVIEDRTFSKPLTAEEKRLKKQFMTAKIPSGTPKFPIPHKPSTATAVSTKADPDGEGQDGTDNLQNDLALQRLLKESHLLDANTFSANGSGSSAPEGAARLRALDMRIRDLGGKKSHMDQERMPIAFRKGMVAKAGQREDKRRTEAKENGIILERFGAKSAGGGAGAATRGGGKERKRGGVVGIGGPDVGTYRGATLRLSKNDIKGIEGSGKRGGSRGGRGGGRGGKRKGPAKFGSGV